MPVSWLLLNAFNGEINKSQDSQDAWPFGSAPAARSRRRADLISLAKRLDVGGVSTAGLETERISMAAFSSGPTVALDQRSRVDPVVSIPFSLHLAERGQLEFAPRTTSRAAADVPMR